VIRPQVEGGAFLRGPIVPLVHPGDAAAAATDMVQHRLCDLEPYSEALKACRALTRMDEVLAGGKKTDKAFLIWFDRTFQVARELTKYQSSQLKALAVAHTPISRPPVDLSRLYTILKVAGPSNVAGARRADGARSAGDRDRPRRLTYRRRHRPGDNDMTH
jgi:hypothetical protein